ncbi:hypothetical protein V6N13_048058 [Hibiscus sabdariffa]
MVSKAIEKFGYGHLLTGTRSINEGHDFTCRYPKTYLISRKHGIMTSKVNGLWASSLHGPSQSLCLSVEPFNIVQSDLSFRKKLSNKDVVGFGIEVDKCMGNGWLIPFMKWNCQLVERRNIVKDCLSQMTQVLLCCESVDVVDD